MRALGQPSDVERPPEALPAASANREKSDDIPHVVSREPDFGAAVREIPGEKPQQGMEPGQDRASLAFGFARRVASPGLAPGPETLHCSSRHGTCPFKRSPG